MEISRRAVIGLLAASPVAFLPGASAPTPCSPPTGDGWMTADIRVLQSDVVRRGGSAQIPGIVRRVHALVLGEERSGTRFATDGALEEAGVRISAFGKDGRQLGEQVMAGAGAIPFARKFDVVEKAVSLIRAGVVGRDVLPESRRETAERFNAELGWVRVELRLAA